MNQDATFDRKLSELGIRVRAVLDIRRGVAVHAVAGNRSNYRPVRSILRPGSDPVEIAQAIRKAYRLNDFYVADLDAIGGAQANRRLYHELKSEGFQLWVDAGIKAADDLKRLTEVDTVVVGLESIQSPKELRSCLDQVGPDRVVFSLDLWAGRPVPGRSSSWAGEDPGVLVQVVYDLGVRRILVLDLVRVGTGTGPGTLELLTEWAPVYRDVEWTVGGGLRDRSDLVEAKNSGASVVLVGSALHDGRFERIIFGEL